MFYKVLAHSPLTLAMMIASSLALANHDLAIELVEVVGKATPRATTEQLFSEAPVTRPTHDAGELLRSVTGMTALRRGGRGFEPIIRGQTQSNLNVISNGAFNYGACPGRMDPPTTYIGVDSFDSVQVIKGHRSVIYGAGGSGGTLLFEHLRPKFAQHSVQGSIVSGYTSNSDLTSLSADVAAGGEKGYVRVFVANKNSDNYEDGNGNNVASSFESNSFGIVAGIDLTEADYLEFSHKRADENDIWYAGNNMDAVFADSRTSTIKWHHHQAVGLLDEIEMTLYRSDVQHLMDNYTVRNRNTMANGMAAPSSSDTWGGRILTTIDTERAKWRAGVDYRANDRNATLYRDIGKNGNYNILVSRMWPDVQQRQTGVFAELDYRNSDKDSLRLGLRVDEFDSSAEDATLLAGMMGAATPTTLYQQFYSSSETDRDHSDVSLVLGWDRTLDTDALFSVNLSRSVRTPDATEQWIARSAMGSFWVGNPQLQPEVHQQLDLTLMQNTEAIEWSATVFYDEIEDYIERYTSGSANLYRNINASLYGVELDGNVRLGDRLEARVGVSYVRGDGDNGDLARISPLQARTNLDYTHDHWAMGVEWILSVRQSHYDPDIDVNAATAGFGVLHLYGHWNITKQWVFEAGIENLLDNAYAYHVNAANADPFNPQAVRVNEPGRQSWAKLRYRF